MFATRKELGRVYVIKLTLPGGVTIWKLGMCKSSRSLDRMMEILRSWFSSYRFVPYTELRLDMKFGRPLELESHIHRILRHKQWLPDHKVDGGTEMFTDINESRVIQFLKQCRDDEFDTPVVLTEEDYKNLGEWLSP